jgi:Tfp pilus assembly protein PilE
MHKKHSGFTIVEMMVAGAVAATLIAMSVQMLTKTALERRSIERRSIALQEAANIVESVAAMSWEEVTAERVGQIRLSEPAQQALGAGILKIVLEPSTSGPPARLVRVEITWPNSIGGTDAPVRLTSWVFAPGKAVSP